MTDRPHPADYMSDAQYEQYLRDGGISDVTIQAGILNESYEPEEQLIIYQHSGDTAELYEFRPKIISAFKSTFEDEAHQKIDALEGGDWITVVDGEVVETGMHHPFAVDVQIH